ncbi:MAG: hypothetical protein M3Q63_02970 [bacterium]|nr:hypothetical protein [bacterium]
MKLQKHKWGIIGCLIGIILTVLGVFLSIGSESPSLYTFLFVPVLFIVYPLMITGPEFLFILSGIPLIVITLISNILFFYVVLKCIGGLIDKKKNNNINSQKKLTIILFITIIVSIIFVWTNQKVLILQFSPALYTIEGGVPSIPYNEANKEYFTEKKDIGNFSRVDATKNNENKVVAKFDKLLTKQQFETVVDDLIKKEIIYTSDGISSVKIYKRSINENENTISIADSGLVVKICDVSGCPPNINPLNIIFTFNRDTFEVLVSVSTEN